MKKNIKIATGSNHKLELSLFSRFHHAILSGIFDKIRDDRDDRGVPRRARVRFSRVFVFFFWRRQSRFLKVFLKFSRNDIAFCKGFSAFYSSPVTLFKGFFKSDNVYRVKALKKA